MSSKLEGAPLILAVAKKIEKTPNCLDMEKWTGTKCCVAGHAVKLAKAKTYDTSLQAQHLMHLNDNEAENVFYSYINLPTNEIVRKLKSLAVCVAARDGETLETLNAKKKKPRRKPRCVVKSTRPRTTKRSSARRNSARRVRRSV